MGTFTLINYADSRFTQSQETNLISGKNIGLFDDCIGFQPKDIDRHFRNENDQILNSQRGGGYWLWKPYFLNKQLRASRSGDMVFYSDAGANFISAVDPIRDILTGLDLMVFELTNTIECEWTKRDAFVLMNCDADKYAETPQRLASFIALRKTSFTEDFVCEYLRYSCSWEIISDAKSALAPDYRGFREHRHDQSILSLLSKKAGLPSFRDPSQYGNKFVNEFLNSSYPQVLDHTRKSDVSGIAKLPTRIARKIGRAYNICRTNLNGKKVGHNKE